MSSQQGLQCRIFGHAWDEVPVGKVIDSYEHPLHYRNVVTLQCLRCETARIDAWNRWGGLGGRRYIYPDDYRELNQRLREAKKEGVSVQAEAKRRYLAARSKERKVEGARGGLRVVGNREPDGQSGGEA